MFHHDSDVGRAIETFDEIERSFGLKPTIRSYDAVLLCCIKNGHTLGAMSFMEEMRQQGVSTTTTVLPWRLLLPQQRQLRKPASTWVALSCSCHGILTCLYTVHAAGRTR